MVLPFGPTPSLCRDEETITSENIVQMKASVESSCMRESNMNETIEDLDVTPYNSASDGKLSDEPGAIEMYHVCK